MERIKYVAVVKTKNVSQELNEGKSLEKIEILEEKILESLKLNDSFNKNVEELYGESIELSRTLKAELDSFEMKITLKKESYFKDQSLYLIYIILEYPTELNEKESLTKFKEEILNIIIGTDFYETYVLEDSQNKEKCKKMYEKIHKIENEMREIINEYMLKKYGMKWFEKNIDKEYKKKSEEYKKWLMGFIGIENIINFKMRDELHNLQVMDLIEMLKKPKFSLASVKKYIDAINKSLGDKATSILELNIPKETSYWEEEQFDLYFGKDFKEKWETFGKIRNSIAHNKVLLNSTFKSFDKELNGIETIIKSIKKDLENKIKSQEKEALNDWKRELIEEYENSSYEEAGIETIKAPDEYIEKILERDEVKKLILLIDKIKENLFYILEEQKEVLETELEENEISLKRIEIIKKYDINKGNILEKIIKTDIKDGIFLIKEELKKIIKKFNEIKDRTKINTNFIQENFQVNLVDLENVNLIDLENIDEKKDITLKLKGSIIPCSGDSDILKLELILPLGKSIINFIEIKYPEIEYDYESSLNNPVSDEEIIIEVEDIYNYLEKYLNNLLEIRRVIDLVE